MLGSPVLTLLIALQFALILVTWVGIALAILTARKKTSGETRMILFLVTAAVLIVAPAALPALPMSRFRIPAVPLFAMLCGIGYFGKFRNEQSTID